MTFYGSFMSEIDYLQSDEEDSSFTGGCGVHVPSQALERLPF